MKLAVLSRNNFAAYFAKFDPHVTKPALTAVPPPNSIVLVFEEDLIQAGTLPKQIIVPDGEVDMFFAWVATYLDVLSPLSSFIEVVSARESLEHPRPEANTVRQNAALAVVIVEAAIQFLRSRAKSNRNLLAAALRCISWAYAQVVIANLSSADAAEVLERWTRLRSALTGLDLPYPLEHVNTFWSNVLPAFGLVGDDSHDNRLLRLNREALERGQLSIERWASIAPEIEASGEALGQLMRGPRQQRIEVLANAANSLPNGHKDHEFYAAFCGYIGSRVADGSLDVWNAVLDRSSRFPTMPLWFAFYCGVTSPENILSYEKSTGRRLLRVLRDQPYDVDAREMLVLSRGAGPLTSEAPLSTPGTIKARLGPDVVGCFLVRDSATSADEPRMRDEQRAREQNTLREAANSIADDPVLLDLLAEAKGASEHTIKMLNRVQKLIGSAKQRPSPEQPDLGLTSLPEDTSRKSKGRRGKG